MESYKIGDRVVFNIDGYVEEFQGVVTQVFGKGKFLVQPDHRNLSPNVKFTNIRKAA